MPLEPNDRWCVHCPGSLKHHSASCALLAQKKIPSERPSARAGEALNEGGKSSGVEHSSKPPAFWLEGQFGVAIYTRVMIDDKITEPCYLTKPHRLGSKADIDGAILFLKTIRGMIDG